MIAFGAPEALEAAVWSHPDVEAAALQVTAAGETASRAGVWSDPVFRAAYSNAPWTTGRISDHPMAGFEIGLSQGIPLSGWRAALKDAALMRQESSGEQARLVHQRLLGEVREAWWDWKEAVLVETVLLERARSIRTEIAEAEAMASIHPQHQRTLVELQLLAAGLEQGISDASARQQRISAQLRAVLGPSMPDLAPSSEVQELPETFNEVLERVEDSPAVSSARSMAQMYTAAAAAARKRGAPDLTLSFGTRFRTFTSATDPGTDLFTVGASIPIAIQRAQRSTAEAKAAMAQSQAQEAGADSAERRVMAALEGLFIEDRRAREQIERIDTERLPLAQDLHRLALEDRGQEQPDSGALLRAELTLLEIELERSRAFVNLWRTQDRMRTLVGEETP